MPEKEGLSSKAYRELRPGESYQPYVPPGQSPLEVTLKAVVAGILFGIVFGAANAYLGLRAGLTISTSIPVAVLTLAAFRLLAKAGRPAGILESNLSQTIGSASSSLASGIIFTLPALFLWQLDPSLLQMTLLALFGGLLGVLFMIPLRRFLIQGEHGRLPYPEGTACAEVLVASDVGGGRARNVFLGLGVGAALKGLLGWARLLPGDFHFPIPFLKKGQLGSDVSAALLGVGYILGPRVAAIMVGGGLLSWLVLIPILAWWGEDRTTPLYPEVIKSISQMGPSELWTRYIRYIGAGAVAAGGLITLAKSLPTIVESFRVGARQIQERLRGGSAAAEERTNQDLPLWFVGAGALLISLCLFLIPNLFGAIQGVVPRLATALLVVIFAFFFVTVSSRIVGLVGVTSNPTSGMTIATLLGTSSVLLFLGWTGPEGQAAAITVGCVVAIAASIAGDTSQDLKTGFLLGATPRRQQLGELAGVLTSAIFVCSAVMLLDSTHGFGTSELPAPQATLMKLVIEGVLQSSLPWGLVGIGVALAIVIELCGIPSLPFAVGVYLPVTTTAPVFMGGLLRWILERRAGSREEAEGRRERGVLFGSGLVGGEGLMGVLIAGYAAIMGATPIGIASLWPEPWASCLPLLVFAVLIWYFARRCMLRR